jgi:hypothetical protein
MKNRREREEALRKEKPGFITSTYVWERNDRDCLANI